MNKWHDKLINTEVRGTHVLIFLLLAFLVLVVYALYLRPEKTAEDYKRIALDTTVDQLRRYRASCRLKELANRGDPTAKEALRIVAEQSDCPQLAVNAIRGLFKHSPDEALAIGRRRLLEFLRTRTPTFSCLGILTLMHEKGELSADFMASVIEQASFAPELQKSLKDFARRKRIIE